MLTIGNDVLRQDLYYIRQLSSGYDELIFTVPLHSNDYSMITEQAIIREEGMEYLVKAIDSSATQAKIKAQINLNAWKAELFPTFTNDSATLAETVAMIIPDGWTYSDEANLAMRRTVALTGVTPLGVLEACRNTYNVTYRFDNKNKVVRLINMAAYTSQGVYASRDFNVTALNYKGKSTDFATRLYAYGANGLSFADINDGKPYVDNFEYSTDVICAYWSDDRYLIKENLLAAAQLKIKELGFPVQSFDCILVDLAKTNPEMYAFLDFSLFSVVTLIDDIKKTRVNHQVVERREYPHYPEKNEVVLSTIAPRITTQLQEVSAEITSSNSALAGKINASSDWMTGGLGGFVFFVLNENKQPIELLISDNGEINAAQNIYKWSSNGLSFTDGGYGGTWVNVATQAGTINGNGKFTFDFLNGTLNVGGILTFDGTNLTVTDDFKVGGGNLARENYSSGDFWVLGIDANGNLSLGSFLCKVLSTSAAETVGNASTRYEVTVQAPTGTPPGNE